MSWIRATFAALSVLLLVSCGGEPDAAPRSAAADRDAGQKALPAGGGEQHDHGAMAPADPHAAHADASDAHAGMDHSAGTSGGTTHDAHASMDHGAAAPTQHDAHAGHSAASGIDAHAQHGGAPTGHEGHRTQRSGVAHDQHASSAAQHLPSGSTAGHEQHSAADSRDDHEAHEATQQQSVHHVAPSHAAASPADPHAAHSGVTAAAAAKTLTRQAPRSNAAIRNLRPGRTLEPDELDAPVPAAVSEARKAQQGGNHEGHGAASPANDDHGGHGSATSPSAAAMYSCPMHPEVVSSEPGTCPKCGMNLIRKR